MNNMTSDPIICNRCGAVDQHFTSECVKFLNAGDTELLALPIADRNWASLLANRLSHVGGGRYSDACRQVVIDYTSRGREALYAEYQNGGRFGNL